MLEDRIGFLNSRTERIIADGFLSSELISFYKALFSFQADSLNGMRSNPAVKIFTAAAGFPRISADNFILPEGAADYLKVSAGALAELIKKFQPAMDLSSAASHLATGENIQAAASTLLAHDFAALSKTAGEMKTLSEGYLFLLINLLKPLFAALSESAPADSAEDDWLEPVCPFCGYIPDFASIHEDEDNKLYLHCGLCETRWKYRRISCFNCGNTDHEKIQLFESETDAKHQVSACDECKAYIKTFRLPKSYDSTSFDLYLENIISSYLDAEVMDMGYSRP